MSPPPNPWGCAAASAGIALLAACTPPTFEIPLTSTSGSGSGSVTGSSSADGSTGAGSTVTDGSSSSGAPSECVPAETWWDPAWGSRRSLEIDTSIVAGPLTNFPMLVRLDADALGATWSERRGADLRFRSADDSSAIDYEVDDLGADGRLPVWLDLPQLDPRAGPLTVWMYYDNPEAAAGSSPADVWVDHVSVHHLGESLHDSLGNHDGVSQWEPEPCTGRCEPRIGAARSFEPEQIHEVLLENSEALNFGSDPYRSTFSFSVSLWMRSDGFSSFPWGPFIAKGDGTWRVHTFASSDFFALGMDCQAPCGTEVDALGNYNLPAERFNINDDQWHHIAMTFGPTRMRPDPPPANWDPDVQVRIYVDGVVAASDVLTGFFVAADAQPVRLGHNANTQARYRGELDEVRIIDQALSPEWIASEFAVVDGEPLTEGVTQEVCP